MPYASSAPEILKYEFLFMRNILSSNKFDVNKLNIGIN